MATTLIAKKLKQLRKENGMTQVDLAMKSGVGLNFARKLASGKVDFHKKCAKTFFGTTEAPALDYSRDELLQNVCGSL